MTRQKPPCLEEGCTTPSAYKGRCRRHHHRLYMRAYTARGAAALKRAKTKYRSSKKGREADARMYVAHRASRIASAWRCQLRTKYGITEDDYNLLLKLQHGRCAICRTLPTKRRLCVDHCHKGGAVRGLLCNSCNRAIVALERDEKWATCAVAYLQKVK